MAVQVSRSRHGYLALRIFWHGRDQWVGTKLRDDGEAGKNRRRLEAKAILVSERLEAGDELHAALLTVLGDCPPRLMPDKPASEAKPITLGEFAEWWLTHIAERERRNYWRKATSYVRNIILPILGKKTPLAEITTAKVKKLQDDLLRRRVRRTDRDTGKRSIRTVKVKTVRNIVTSYFRSLIVEAMERHGVPAIDPFPANLRWPKEDTIVGVVCERRAGSVRREGTRPHPRVVSAEQAVLVRVPLLPVLDGLPTFRNGCATRGRRRPPGRYRADQQEPR